MEVFLIVCLVVAVILATSWKVSLKYEIKGSDAYKMQFHTARREAQKLSKQFHELQCAQQYNRGLQVARETDVAYRALLQKTESKERTTLLFKGQKGA